MPHFDSIAAGPQNDTCGEMGMRRSGVFIFLALFSLAFSLFCFTVNLAHCSRHVPDPVRMLWAVPLSLLGGIVFLYLFYFCWNARLPGASRHVLKDRTLIFKKMLALIPSFFVAASIPDGLMDLGKIIGIDFGNPDWLRSCYQAFALLAGIVIASFVYKKIVKKLA